MPMSFCRSRFQVLQTLIESQVFQSVDADLDPQEGAEFLIHAGHELFAVDPHHMMTMVELLQNAMELASQPLGDTHSEDVGHLVGGQAEQAYFAGPFENLMDWKVPFEDEVPAVFDLIDRVLSA
jgi:hypothetical protein